MTEKPLENLIELTSLATGDIIYVVDDPSGTPLGKKITIDNVFSLLDSNTRTFTNKTLTSPVLNTGVSGTAVLDEDNMASDSATQLATQQSIKAYVDANGGISNVVEDTTPQLGGDLDGQDNNLDSINSLYLNEKANANADITGDGQVWVQTATPNLLMFTDDAGTDFQIATLSGTETITNKTIDSANNTISNLGDSEVSGISASKINAGQLALARGGTGQDLSGKTVAVLEDAQTFTAQQTFDEDIETKGGIKINKKLTKFFEDYFSYSGVTSNIPTNSPWTFSTLQGTNTGSIQDGIDQGYRITTGSTSGDRSHLTLNDKRHFDPNNFTLYGIVLVDVNNSSGMLLECGLADRGVSTSGAATAVVLECLASQSANILLNVREGDVGVTRVATDVASVADQPIHFKIVSNGTDRRLYLLVSGEWTLKATENTRSPTAACQPVLDVGTNENVSHYGEILRIRVENDS